MNSFIKMIKRWIKNFPAKTMYVGQLFMSSNIPLYSSNAAFFLTMAIIPIFMLIFSTISLIPNVHINDITTYINHLFPNLPYMNKVVNTIFNIAEGLTSKNVISVNVLTAIVVCSTALSTLIFGVRKIHDIREASGFLAMRALSLLSMLIFFMVIMFMLFAFAFSDVFMEIIGEYVPKLENVLRDIARVRYVTSIIILVVLMLSLYATATNFVRKIRHNIVGATIATILWIAGSEVFSLYYTNFPLNSKVYGSLVGIVVAMLWIYISINIIFLGAVINEVFYPEQRILREQKAHLTELIRLGKDKKVDGIIRKKLKNFKFPHFNRPKLNRDYSYE